MISVFTGIQFNSIMSSCHRIIKKKSSLLTEAENSTCSTINQPRQKDMSENVANTKRQITWALDSFQTWLNLKKLKHKIQLDKKTVEHGP